MHKKSYYVVNAITLYRLIAAFVLFYLLLKREVNVFKWLLALSFCTDAVDGYLARKYKVISVFGSRMDSIADDLTVFVAIIGIVVLQPAFLHRQIVFVMILAALYLIQTIVSLVRYGKITSFHTYAAKIAAVLQGLFLILFFFLPQWPMALFYAAVTATALDLAEETIMAILLPEWTADVKGLLWMGKNRRR